MIEDALRYQTQGFDWVERVLIGGGVLFLGFIFLVPLLTFNGYMLEVMRRVMDGKTASPPEWGEFDLVDTTVWGLKHGVIVLVFSVALFLLVGIPFALIVGVGVAADVGAISLLGALVAGVVYLVGTLALAVVLPVATGNFVRTGTIGAAFDVGVLRRVVTNRTMLTAVLYAFIANIIIGVVSGALGATIVGYLAVPFVSFAGQSAIFYIWAGGFADAYEEEYGERPTVPAGPLKPEVTVAEDGAAGKGGSVPAGAGDTGTGTGTSTGTGTGTGTGNATDSEATESQSGPDLNDDRRWE